MPMPLLAAVAPAFSCMTNEVASGTVAAMRCSTRRMRSTGWFLATMKRTDSGSSRAISTVNTSGVIPPSTRTLRQPHCGIIQAARKPPKAAPNGKPQNMALVIVARRPSGQYSLIKVTALGMAAPSPTPVMKRQTTSCARLRATAATAQRSRGQGAGRQAEQRRTQNRRQSRPLQSPFGDQRWSDVADGSGVEPVQENDAKTKREDHPLKARERML